jgi:hypothetical protein
MEIPIFREAKNDALVKNYRIVMPDLIRNPEPSEITGFRPSPE